MLGKKAHWASFNPLPDEDNLSQYSATHSNLSGKKAHWNSFNTLPDDDNLSQYSATHSNASAYDLSRSPDIGQRMHTLFKEQLYTDVKFIISSGVRPKQVILAHKAILAIGSRKFQKMFYGRSDKIGCREVQINNIPYNAFRNVIEYLYTDDVVFDDDQTVLETLAAASAFEVQPLVDKCEYFIECVDLTEDNVCSKFQMAISGKLTSLKNKCIEFIQDNTSSVLRSADFLSVDSSTVQAICKMEKFNLRSEIELLNSLIRYIDAHSPSKTNKRVQIEPYLRHIRLLNVSCEEFNNFVQRHPFIFTASETANILTAIANPANVAPILPSWCKSGHNRCHHQHQLTPKITTQTRTSYSTRKMSILLKPASKANDIFPSLVCYLEMICLRGKYKIEGLKLSFDDPVTVNSVIGNLTIHVNVEPSRYHFEEHLQIKQSKNIELKFSRSLLARQGQKVIIRAIAKEVHDYRFLQFDDNNSCMQDVPFTCSLGSIPKGYRFFFISEVIYHELAMRPPNYPTRR